MTDQELSEELLVEKLVGKNFLAQYFPNIWKQQRLSKEQKEQISRPPITANTDLCDVGTDDRR